MDEFYLGKIRAETAKHRRAMARLERESELLRQTDYLLFALAMFLGFIMFATALGIKWFT